jgi:hypothetical protein
MPHIQLLERQLGVHNNMPELEHEEATKNPVLTHPFCGIKEKRKPFDLISL